MTRKEIIDALKLATKRHDGMHLRAKTDKRWYVAVAVKKKLLREAILALSEDKYIAYWEKKSTPIVQPWEYEE